MLRRRPLIRDRGLGRQGRLSVSGPFCAQWVKRHWLAITGRLQARSDLSADARRSAAAADASLPHVCWLWPPSGVPCHSPSLDGSRSYAWRVLDVFRRRRHIPRPAFRLLPCLAPVQGLEFLGVMEVPIGIGSAVGEVGACCWRCWGLGRGPLLFPVGSAAWMPMDRFFHSNHCCRGHPLYSAAPLATWLDVSSSRIADRAPVDRLFSVALFSQRVIHCLYHSDSGTGSLREHG